MRDEGEHVGVGLPIARLVNGAPQIITNTKLNTRATMLVDLEKKGEAKELLKLVAYYKEQQKKAKAALEKQRKAHKKGAVRYTSQQRVNHYTEMINATKRVLEGKV